MLSLEEKVLSELSAHDLYSPQLRYGVAVSGGADSVSLLIAMSEILDTSKNPLYVITIDHNIRPEKESKGDADFVVDLCKKLKAQGKNVECKVETFPKNYVTEVAEKRHGGIEEAARFLRYDAFSRFIEDNNLSFLCLAHNKNDQLETILMRFLNGSSVEALSGIQFQRGKYIRPLLNVERFEIESYLNEKQLGWRTDNTNLSTDYERNKIRLKLVPLLNSQFPDWKESVLSGSRKYRNDGNFISSLMDEVKLTCNDDCCYIKWVDFLPLQEEIKYRVLMKACNLMGETSRISYEFVMDFINSVSENKNKEFSKSFGSIEISSKKDGVFVKKQVYNNTELVFFDIIEETGKYLFPFGELQVNSENHNLCKVFIGSDSKQAGSFSYEMELPFIVRNVRMDDSIENSDGNNKKVSDIFSDWHVKTEDKSLIPVLQSLIEDGQPVKVIAGRFLGYKDWIVKK